MSEENAGEGEAEVELTVQQRIEKSMIKIFSKMAQERAESERNMILNREESEKNMMLNITKMFEDFRTIMNKSSVNNEIKIAEIKPEDEVKSAIAVVSSAPLIVDEVEILEIPAGFTEIIAVKNKAIYDVLKKHRSNLVKPSFTASGVSISKMLKVFYAFLFDGINGLMSFKIGVECFIFDPGGMCKEFKDFSRLGLSLRAFDICFHIDGCLTNRF